MSYRSADRVSSGVLSGSPVFVEKTDPLARWRPAPRVRWITVLRRLLSILLVGLVGAALPAAGRAEEPAFDLLRAPPPRVTIGKTATFSLSIAPRPTYRLHAD